MSDDEWIENAPTCPCCCGQRCGTGQQIADMQARIRELEAEVACLRAEAELTETRLSEANTRVRELEAENERLLEDKEAAGKNARHCVECVVQAESVADAAESRLATATTLLTQWLGWVKGKVNRRALVGGTRAFLANQPTAPDPWHSEPETFCGNCQDYGHPVSMHRRAPAHITCGDSSCAGPHQPEAQEHVGMTAWGDPTPEHMRKPVTKAEPLPVTVHLPSKYWGVDVLALLTRTEAEPDEPLRCDNCGSTLHLEPVDLGNGVACKKGYGCYRWSEAEQAVLDAMAAITEPDLRHAVKAGQNLMRDLALAHEPWGMVAARAELARRGLKP